MASFAMAMMGPYMIEPTLEVYNTASVLESNMPLSRDPDTYPSDFDGIDHIHVPLVTSRALGLRIQYDTSKREDTHL